MKNLTRSIVSIVGEFPYLIYLDIRKKYFPSKSQRLLLEKEKQEFTKSIEFFSAFIKPGDLCFDVGANMGKRVETFLKLGARVVAIEPQRIFSKYLKLKFGKKITIINIGLGEREEIRKIFISPALVTSTFSEEFMIKMQRTTLNSSNLKYAYFWNKTKLINLSSLDILIKKYNRPEFIKIDVEGYELNVLKGLSKSVKFLSFECHIPAMTTEAIECIERLVEINNNVKFNYSIGETMDFYLKNWVDKAEIINTLNNLNFINTHSRISDYGDLYAKFDMK